MKLHIDMALKPSENKIKYGDKLFFIGSCFAENFGDKSIHLGFDSYINPYGILFNPYSIANALEEIISNKKYQKEDLVFYQNEYLSLNHHGSFRNKNSDDLLNKINTEIDKGHAFLKETKYLFITLGTAWSYQYLKDNTTVANCHKIPSNQFEKELLSIENLEIKWQDLIGQLKVFNPDIEIIFTVSPVKYLRWGTHENNIGKSVLFLLLYQLKQKNDLQYFPAFELVQDDLRDYRFYKEDFAHPNELAIEYVWEKWSEVFLEEYTQKLMEEVHKFQQLKTHKVRGDKDETEMHQQKINQKYSELKAKNPHIILEH